MNEDSCSLMMTQSPLGNQMRSQVSWIKNRACFMRLVEHVDTHNKIMRLVEHGGTHNKKQKIVTCKIKDFSLELMSNRLTGNDDSRCSAVAN